MTVPTVKYQSGVEVSLAAYLLKLTSLDVGHRPRVSINRKSSGAPDVRTHSTHHQWEELHER
jgi:hypothetical protein